MYYYIIVKQAKARCQHALECICLFILKYFNGPETPGNDCPVTDLDTERQDGKF